MKTCKRCGRENLPAAAFYSNKRMKDGLSFYCSDCMKGAVIASIEKYEPAVAPSNDLFNYCEHCGLPVYTDMALHVWARHGGR